MHSKTLNPSLRLSGVLLLIGQLLYILATQFHAGGEANDHHAIFAVYAGNGIWTLVHFTQFVAMAIMLAGLFALFFALDVEDGVTKWAGRFGAASAVTALALYGALQAVDGVANKQADNAWVNAPDAEKTARFASAEAIRWVEWGMRSYQNYALGFAFLLFAAALIRTAWVSRPIAYMMGISGLAYLAQGWIVGVEGFSQAMSIAIVIAWVLDVAWMIWLLVVAWRMRGVPAGLQFDDGLGRPEAMRA
jgi:hypothetical protein